MDSLSRSGAFAESVDKRVERFTESISFDCELFAHDIRASIAHAEMLASEQVLTVDESTQIKQALNETPADRAAVEALVASGDQNTKDGWTHASTFKRDHALFIGAAAYLGWSNEKIDQLMILAASFK